MKSSLITVFFRIGYKVKKLLKIIQKKALRRIKKVVGLHPLSETVVKLISSLKNVVFSLVFKS